MLGSAAHLGSASHTVLVGPVGVRLGFACVNSQRGPCWEPGRLPPDPCAPLSQVASAPRGSGSGPQLCLAGLVTVASGHVGLCSFRLVFSCIFCIQEGLGGLSFLFCHLNKWHTLLWSRHHLLCPLPPCPTSNKVPSRRDQGSLGTCRWSRRWWGSDGDAQAPAAGMRTGPAEPPGHDGTLGAGALLCVARAERVQHVLQVPLPVTRRRLRTFGAAGSMTLPVPPFIPLKQCLYCGRVYLRGDLLLEPLLSAQSPSRSRIVAFATIFFWASSVPLDTPFPSLSPRASHESSCRLCRPCHTAGASLPLWVQAVSWSRWAAESEAPQEPLFPTQGPMPWTHWSPLQPQGLDSACFAQVSFCSRSFHRDLYGHDSPALLRASG